MQIVCMDDEVLILEMTVSMCRELPSAPDVTGFHRSDDTLAWLKDHRADIVILDINMPDTDGITLAARIKELQPDAALIFLTGYSEYALDAFGLHASGYLLKPVNAEKLAAEVEYAAACRVAKKEPARVVVKTFGEFDIFVGDQPVIFKRARAKELLAYLIDRQGGFVTRANVFAALWEDALYDRSMQKQLDVIIRSLKSTLEEYGIGDIIEIRKGQMRVLPEKLECDLYRFLQGNIDAVDAYRGEYMNAYPWAGMTESYMGRLGLPK